MLFLFLTFFVLSLSRGDDKGAHSGILGACGNWYFFLLFAPLPKT
ncbi:hypothetical protein GLYMA_06G265480v4 [Glycine max]|nr:hypothetical protein GLYMA_06G265480v4 [Glycine max]KAH1127777.1 hypothetical protein GYH30_016372 [Glycine max]